MAPGSLGGGNQGENHPMASDLILKESYEWCLIAHMHLNSLNRSSNTSVKWL